LQHLGKMGENQDSALHVNSSSTPRQSPTCGRTFCMDRGSGWQKWVRDSHPSGKTCTDGGSGPTVDVRHVIGTMKMRTTFSMPLTYPTKKDCWFHTIRTI
jgi:hypothetical protein